jgi:hypothetical protein
LAVRPTLEGIRQGALGDCFFMCVIGATVNRDPQIVRRMLCWPAGLENGYPVKKGVFQIPLEDFVRVFKAITYETSAPLPAA